MWGFPQSPAQTHPLKQLKELRQRPTLLQSRCTSQTTQATWCGSGGRADPSLLGPHSMNEPQGRSLLRQAPFISAHKDYTQPPAPTHLLEDEGKGTYLPSEPSNPFRDPAEATC